LSGDIKQLDEAGAYIETPSGHCGIHTPTHLIGAPMTEDKKGVQGIFMYHDCITDPFQFTNNAESLDDTGKEMEEKLRRAFADYSWK
ncbi:MAG: hypothetical protein HRT89_16400, partial [Lentisphaeria bacterium]|nr:hypothetical protein [Lentisphaeria bacterium]NQZ69641.1 hypothetical protein [Lentisphaeria bacterium]